MTIELGDTTLCAGQARNSTGSPVGPDGLTISDSPGVMSRQYVGADRVAPEHVGCDSCIVSFKVVRVFGRVADALAYATHGVFQEDVEGALKFDGTTRLSRAAVKSRVVVHNGCAVAVSYTIEG